MSNWLEKMNVYTPTPMKNIIGKFSKKITNKNSNFCLILFRRTKKFNPNFENIGAGNQ